MWLLSFSDPKRGVGWNPASRGGLEWNVRRTRILLDLAGAPDRALRVVLVAGTKGKGSTAAMLASVLAASGIRTGLSTKPHLQDFRERVRVHGQAISADALARRANELRPIVDALSRLAPRAGSPTTFELTTVLALSHYAVERCEVAIVEVGLGGRYDATNATDPLVSVVTAISHDHTRELGTHLTAIAREKAGILRPGRVAVIAPQVAAARRSLLAVCANVGAQAREVRPIARGSDVADALTLRGDHQRANAACALAAADALAEHGVGYRWEAAPEGLRRLRWPGRFEVLEGTPALVLDGAHNDGSAEALAAALRREFPRRGLRFVLGLMADKDARAVVRPLLPLARSVDTTRVASPRALDPRALARLCRGVTVRTHDDPAEAMAAARRAAVDRDVVCITGSLALVARAREVLGLPVAERIW